MKKGLVQSEMLRYILITVVGFLILTFGILVIRGCSERRREAELIGFKEDIKGSIEVIATRIGSVDREQFIVPQDIELVCFLDLEHRDEILETPLVDKYLFMKDSLEAEAEENIFLIASDMLKDVFYEEGVCFKTYPYYQCIEASYGEIDVFLEGLGDCTTIFTNYTKWISNNVRNSEKYPQGVGFLIKDKETAEGDRDILMAIPLAFVNSKEEYTTYPYLVYYGDINEGQVTFIKGQKGMDEAVIFEESYCPSGAICETLDMENYLSYWSTIYDVTIIDYDYDDGGEIKLREGALIASLFAAFTNTPLIFIDSNNLADYEALLNGKNVNVIDENDIDSAVIDFIENPANIINARYFGSSDLRLLNQNRILSLESDIIIP